MRYLTLILATLTACSSPSIDEATFDADTSTEDSTDGGDMGGTGTEGATESGTEDSTEGGDDSTTGEPVTTGGDGTTTGGETGTTTGGPDDPYYDECFDDLIGLHNHQMIVGVSGACVGAWPASKAGYACWEVRGQDLAQSDCEAAGGLYHPGTCAAYVANNAETWFATVSAGETGPDDERCSNGNTWWRAHVLDLESAHMADAWFTNDFWPNPAAY